MKSNKSTIIWVVAIVLVLVGLFGWSKINDPNKELKKKITEAGVECLSSGAKLAQHIHPHLVIKMGGKDVNIPANIGIINGCESEIHTHDTTGIIHVESPRGDQAFTLNQFFVVWNRPLEQEGYTLKATVDKKPLENPKGLILKEKQEILLEYIKK